MRIGQSRAGRSHRKIAKVHYRPSDDWQRDHRNRRSGKTFLHGGGGMSAQPSIPAKILLIDTNVFFARRVGAALKNEGFDVVHSTQSAYALTMLEYDTPSAILCSTTLREMNAHQLPPLVHADPKMAHIPVIAMGEGGDHALMEAFRAGCADYVDKRLGPEVIAAHIKSFLLTRQHGFHPAQILGPSDTALTEHLSHLY